MIALWFMAFVAVVVVAVAAVAVVRVVVRARESRRKTRRMVAFAHHRGWRHAPEDHALIRRYPGPPFGVGVNKRATHVLTGHHRGAPFMVFEYRYTDSGRQSAAAAHRFTVTVVALPVVRPWLEVTSENGLTRFLGRLGLRDLQLESEEFNGTFHVLTDNERFAYDVLNPTTMAWLLSDPRARSHPFRFGGDYLMAWCEAPIEPEVALGVLDYASDVRDRVPAFVWRS